MRKSGPGRRRAWRASAALALLVLACAGCVARSTGPAATGEGVLVAQGALVARGQYLATIMDCGGCHTSGALAGRPDPNRHLAGSEIGFGFPGGVVYPPNLTPDPETGLGRWTDDQIVRAIRHGQRPDGRVLVPIMPWPAYAALTEPDARALVAYLRQIRVVRYQAPANVPPGGRAVAPYLGVVTP